MALTIQTNNAAVTALKNLNTNTIAMNKSLERLSSGFRINSAADDASGYAISAKLERQAAGLKAGMLNVTQATAMVKMADSAINEIQNMLVRIQTLATQASSAQNVGEADKLEAERVKLETQIDKIAGSVNYNGVYMLNGSETTALTFQVGAENATADQVTVDFSANYQATALGLSGSAATVFLTTDGGAAAQAYIATVKTAIDNLVTNRADLGAVQNQLSYVSSSLATSIEQMTASVSSIRDADMAAEMADFTKSQILVQAGTAMLAQANQSAQNVLSLFR